MLISPSTALHYSEVPPAALGKTYSPECSLRTRITSRHFKLFFTLFVLWKYVKPSCAFKVLFSFAAVPGPLLKKKTKNSCRAFISQVPACLAPAHILVLPPPAGRAWRSARPSERQCSIDGRSTRSWTRVYPVTFWTILRCFCRPCFRLGHCCWRFVSVMFVFILWASKQSLFESSRLGCKLGVASDCRLISSRAA